MKLFETIFGPKKEKAMTTLTAGMNAPDFSLTDMDGNAFSLLDQLQKGPVVAAFFKVSCPVCQYAFPFLDRIYKNSSGKPASFLGVSQNNHNDTAEFVKKYRVTFPVGIDDLQTFPVSNAYGLTNVPSVFLIGPDRQIQLASVGWSKNDMEDLAQKLSNDHPRRIPLFGPGEKIAEFRAG